MNHSEQLTELATALAAAQADLTAIPKDANNPFFKSSYASLPKVVEVASPIITKQGLSVSQLIGCDDHGDTLTTMLLHKSGQFITSTMRLHLTKTDAQGQGSAVSYARRYSYMAILGLVADEDDDGNRASTPKAPAKAAKPADPLLSTGKLQMMLGSAKFASGLEDREAVLRFFTEETGKKPTEVHESELPGILAHFKSLSVGDDEVRV